MEIRHATRAEVPALAQLWYDAWQDAHAAILPEELKRDRTVASFEERLLQLLPDVRAAGPAGAPVAFCIVKGDELYQLFVAREARGTGIAAALVADAEARMAAGGVKTAWLSCAIGNDRAARFYEKCGWRRAGHMLSLLQISTGEFPLETWRYEKALVRTGRPPSGP
jgi:GNAT superfamily N-acetyltransferase